MIREARGDALTAPPPCLFVHVVNDVGAWGAGFSGALSRAYPWAGRAYRAWAAASALPAGCVRTGPLALGGILFQDLGDGHDVAHLCAQLGVGQRPRTCRVDYAALEHALSAARRYAQARSFERVAMPRIGCGLAGGDWRTVRAIVERAMADLDVAVYVLP